MNAKVFVTALLARAMMCAAGQPYSVEDYWRSHAPKGTECLSYCQDWHLVENGEQAGGLVKIYHQLGSTWGFLEATVENSRLVPKDVDIEAHLHVSECKPDWRDVPLQQDLLTFSGEKYLWMLKGEGQPRRSAAETYKVQVPEPLDGAASTVIHDSSEAKHMCCTMISCVPPETMTCRAESDRWTLLNNTVATMMKGHIELYSQDTGAGDSWVLLDLSFLPVNTSDEIWREDFKVSLYAGTEENIGQLWESNGATMSTVLPGNKFSGFHRVHVANLAGVQLPDVASDAYTVLVTHANRPLAAVQVHPCQHPFRQTPRGLGNADSKSNRKKAIFGFIAAVTGLFLLAGSVWAVMYFRKSRRKPMLHASPTTEMHPLRKNYVHNASMTYDEMEARAAHYVRPDDGPHSGTGTDLDRTIAHHSGPRAISGSRGSPVPLTTIQGTSLSSGISISDLSRFYGDTAEDEAPDARIGGGTDVGARSAAPATQWEQQQLWSMEPVGETGLTVMHPSPMHAPAPQPGLRGGAAPPGAVASAQVIPPHASAGLDDETETAFVRYGRGRSAFSRHSASSPRARTGRTDLSSLRHSSHISEQPWQEANNPVMYNEDDTESDPLYQVHLLLDAYNEHDEALCGKYRILDGDDNRREGGQGLVVFAKMHRDHLARLPQQARKSLAMKSLAIKFFTEQSLFQQEANIYNNGSKELLDIMPKVHDIYDQFAVDESQLEVSPNQFFVPPFIVLDKGITLQDWWAEQKPDYYAAVDALLKVVVCVRELHKAGFAHCDLKPSNILYAHPDWKLIDFASCRKLDKRGKISCTLMWAAPEVIMVLRTGRHHVMTKSTMDTWALGMIIFTMLTGVDPWDELEEHPAYKNNREPGRSEELFQQLMVARLVGGDNGWVFKFPWERPRSAAWKRHKQKLGRLENMVVRMLNRNALERPSLEEVQDSIAHVIGSRPSC